MQLLVVYNKSRRVRQGLVDCLQESVHARCCNFLCLQGIVWGYTCAPSFTSMRATISKFEQWRSGFKENCPRLFVVVVVMERMLHTCVPSFISMRSTVNEFEVILKKSDWDYLLLWSSWKWCYTHAYQVSSPCVVPLASLRSEDVILKKSAWGYLSLWLSWKWCNT